MTKQVKKEMLDSGDMKKKGLPKRMKRPSKKAPSWSEMSPSQKKMFRNVVAIDKILYGADKIVKDVSKKEGVGVAGPKERRVATKKAAKARRVATKSKAKARRVTTKARSKRR